MQPRMRERSIRSGDDRVRGRVAIAEPARPRIASQLGRPGRGHLASSTFHSLCLIGILIAVGSFSAASGIAQESSEKQWHVAKVPGSAGLRHYSPGTWGIVDVSVGNRGEEATEVLVASHFEEDPTLQYGRRIWIPAHSRRSTWYSVLPPGGNRPAQGRYNLKSLLLSARENTASTAQWQRSQLLATSWLSAKHRRLATGMIQDAAGEGRNFPYELVVALRIASGLPREISTFHGESLPPIPSALEGMDQLIVCGDRPADDVAGLSALRHWLLGGGRLWIMLDCVSPETAGLLLEDAYDCEIVDETELTKFEIQPVDVREPVSGRREFEQPIKFVRVLPGAATVTHEVNGWPAAFWKPAGRGRILFTTLAARGWLRETDGQGRGQRNSKGEDPTSSRLVPTKELSSLGRLFLAPRQPLPFQAKQLQPALTEQIGYEIVSRNTLLVLLSGFCLTLLVVGLVLVGRKRLEWLGWLGPTFAVGISIVIIVLGVQSRRTVPNTAVDLQIVNTSPDSEHLNVQGLAALFNRSSSGAEIGAANEGHLVLDATGLTGRVRRVIQTDVNRWHIQNLELPAGVRFAPFKVPVRYPTKVQVRATFGPNGLTGRVTKGPFGTFADTVIATEAGQTVGLRFDDRGNPNVFSVRTSDVLPEGEFISGTLLSDEQRRRQEIYRQLVPGPNSKPFPTEPTLMTWAPRLDLGFDFPDQERQIGSALVLAPVVLDRPPPKSDVLIPSPFLPYRMDPRREASLAYSNQERRWQARRRGARTWLRIQFPHAVLPLRVDSVTTTLHIKGPSNQLEIAGLVDDQPTILASKDDPLGTLSFTIDRSDVLQLDERGSLLVGVFVAGVEDSRSDSSNFEGETNQWQIEFLHFEARGQTLKR